ncbi:MAG: ABC transporter substrate-binding protein [Chloroflexota bacterium]|nr:MAG: ABC transporter substrate-binding protein [Chloroflexota bacterium]
MPVSRRAFLSGLAASAAAAALAACAAPAATPAPAKPAEAPKPAAPAPAAPAPAATKPAEAPKPAAPAPAAAKPAEAPKPVEASKPAATDSGVLKAPDGPAKRGGILKAAFGVTTSNFDLNQGAAAHVLIQLYNNLIRFNPNDGLATIIPELATTWTKSPDGKTFTFTLREGVKFHDGTVFSSADVVATYMRVKNPVDGTISANKGLMEAVAKIEAPNANTVVFTMSKPVPYLLEVLANPSMAVYSKKSIDENKGDLRKVIAPGTGAFKVKDHKAGERWIFEKNTDYWNKELPYIDGIEMIHAAAWSDRGTAVLTQQADVSWNVSIETWEEGKKKPNDVKVNLFPSTGAYMLYLNSAKKPLDNAGIRRAIHLSLSRQDLFIAFQTQEPMELTRYQSHASPYALPPADVAKLPAYRKDKTADLEEAKKLLTAGGVTGTLSLELLCANVAPHAELLAPAVQGMLKKVGIEVKIRTVERANLVEELKKGQYDIMLNTIGFPTVDPVTGWLLNFKTGSSQNWGKYSNPELDKLIDSVEVEQDEAKRKQLVNQVEDILDKDSPWAMIGWTNHLPMWRSYVKGLSLDKRKFVEWGKFDVAWLDK